MTPDAPLRPLNATESDEQPQTAPTGTDEEFWAHVDRIEEAILDQAPVWETEFNAGPGMVCSVRDAAVVAARATAEAEATP